MISIAEKLPTDLLVNTFGPHYSCKQGNPQVTSHNEIADPFRWAEGKTNLYILSKCDNWMAVFINQNVSLKGGDAKVYFDI